MATKLCHLLRYCTCCFWITKCLTYIPIWFPCKFSYSWTSTHRQAYKMQSSYLPSEPMARCTRPSCLQIWQKPITSTWRYSRKVLLCQWMCLNSQPGWLGGVLSAYRRKGPWPCHCPWQLEPCALWWWLCSQRILSWWTPPPCRMASVSRCLSRWMLSPHQGLVSCSFGGEHAQGRRAVVGRRSSSCRRHSLKMSGWLAFRELSALCSSDKIVLHQFKIISYLMFFRSQNISNLTKII